MNGRPPIVDSGRPPPSSVSIAILTYRRPELISRAIRSVDSSAISGPTPIVEIIVVDNDAMPSAQEIVQAVSVANYPLRYVHEPRAGLAAARNRALDECSSDVLVFLDDDETAGENWPRGLLNEMIRSGAALVGGPVEPSFDQPPPEWVHVGCFFDRPRSPTGTPRPWLASNNLAIDMRVVRSSGVRFDAAFGHSGAEDAAFSFDVAALGHHLTWCDDATVIESIPPERVSISWLTRRERRATSGFVRARRRNEPVAPLILRSIGSAAVRLAQGVGLIAAGATRRQKHLFAKGAIRIGRAWGTMDGLLDKQPHAYGGPMGSPACDH